MLSSIAAPIYVAAIGLAHDGEASGDSHDLAQCDASAALLELAAAALDQALGSGPIEPSAVQLLVFASDSFDGDRPPSSDLHDRGPLLDNAFNDAVVRRLVLDSGLTAAQPHGVFLAEGLALCAALATARAFILGEEDLHDVVVVTTYGDRPGHRHASACLVTTTAQAAPVLVDVDLVTNLDGTRESMVAATHFDLLYARPGQVQTSAAALLRRWLNATSADHPRGCAVIECGADGLGIARLRAPQPGEGTSA